MSEGDDYPEGTEGDGCLKGTRWGWLSGGTQKGWLDSHPLTSEIVLNSRLFADLELILADAAQWAYPILRDIFKCSSRGNSAVRVSCSRIVNVSADYTNILFHFVFNLSGITFRHRTPPGVPLCRYSNLAIYHIHNAGYLNFYITHCRISFLIPVSFSYTAEVSIMVYFRTFLFRTLPD